MNYTEEKPNKEGWYWFRYWRHNSTEPIEFIVRVYEQGGKWFADNGKYDDDLSELVGEFAGPIEKAED